MQCSVWLSDNVWVAWSIRPISMYCNCCVVIYLCALWDGDGGASSPTKRVCVVWKRLEVPKDDLDGSEVCVMVL